MSTVYLVFCSSWYNKQIWGTILLLVEPPYFEICLLEYLSNCFNFLHFQFLMNAGRMNIHKTVFTNFNYCILCLVEIYSYLLGFRSDVLQGQGVFSGVSSETKRKQKQRPDE